jgi:hypothetical protein
MKKLLQASISLLLIGLFTLASQISCKKTTAGPTNSTTTTAKILYTVEIGSPGSPARDSFVVNGRDTTVIQIPAVPSTLQTELHYCNVDGTNPTLVNIPASLILVNNGSARLTPDGTQVIFEAQSSANSPASIYSMGLTGSNLNTAVSATASPNQQVSLLDVN